MSKAVVRVWVIAFLTALSAVTTASDLSVPWHPYGWYGIGVVRADGTVANVEPQAVREGLHAGDRIDLRRMRPEDRFSLQRPARPGRTLQLPLQDGRSIELIAQARPRSRSDNVTAIIEVFASLAYILLAAILVLLRPTRATWAFYLFSYSFCTFAATPNMWPLPFQLTAGGLIPALAAISPAAFLSFALRFPDVRLEPALARFERAILYVVAPLSVSAQLLGYYGFILAGIATPAWAASAETALNDALYGCGIVILIVRYLYADAETRNRLRWVVAAFSIAFLPFVLLVSSFFSEGAGGMNITPTEVNICQSLAILAPIALAYTVLKHRLFDIRLVLSRALMYAVLMSLTVGALALVDWGFSRWLEASRFALIIELALAVAIGVMLTTAHRRVERFLNTVIFRAQTLALQALRRFAQETDLIADPDRLLSQTYDALHARLECDFSAIYTAEGSSFVLATLNNDATPPVLPGDDFAVLRLRRWGEPFECDEPIHPLRAALLVPMTARTHLVGFIVCGPKRDRTHYLPEEIETLTALAHRVGSAYGWLTMSAQASIPQPSFDTSG
jgi:hypothetical protein